MQIRTSLQADNHDSNLPLKFLQARCPFCCPTNSIKALKAKALKAKNTNHKNISYITDRWLLDIQKSRWV